MPVRRPVALGCVAALCFCACRGAETGEVGSAGVPAPNPTIEDYPDAITRELRRQADAIRPVEPSAIPPRHLDEDQFPVSLVDRERIVSGGPPADGIPSIDEPVFEPAPAVDWLAPDETVMVLEHGSEVRIYPTQVMIWHEIVNDVIAGTPVAVTYCPLCNSGSAFERRVGSQVSEFGTSGALYQSNLVMYDRSTESLWTQFDGRAVVGTSVGERLDRLPLTTVAWADAVRAHPDAEVLSRDTGVERPYGRNPYNAYDRRDDPLPGFFVGEVDGRLVPFERVIGIETLDEAVALRRSDVTERGVVEIELSAGPVTVWSVAGARSPLNDGVIADGDAIGAVAVYESTLDDRRLTFVRIDERAIVDEETGSTWDVLGRAVSGPLEGATLDPVVHIDTFWFSWATFQVEPVLIRPGDR